MPAQGLWEIFQAGMVKVGHRGNVDHSVIKNEVNVNGGLTEQFAITSISLPYAFPHIARLCAEFYNQLFKTAGHLKAPKWAVERITLANRSLFIGKRPRKSVQG